jgi:hypothetical protein
MKNGRTSREEIEFDAVLGVGVESVISFTRITSFSYDPHYGADADGRRGWPMTFIDEDLFENVKLNGEPLGTYPTDVVRDVNAKVEKYLEDHLPEEPEVPRTRRR